MTTRMLGNQSSGVTCKNKNYFSQCFEARCPGNGPVYIAVFILSTLPSEPPSPLETEVINLRTRATKGGHMARICFGRQQESCDWPSQLGVDEIFEGGGCMVGRETGDSGGSLAAIFSPLGVPTLAREVVDSVSIYSSLLNHEKSENLKKENR